MNFIYFVGFSARGVERNQIITGNHEISLEQEITNIAQTQNLVGELSNHYSGQYKDFIITGLHLLRTEE